MKNNKIKFADLFAGCGGLSYGFLKNSKFKHVLATDVWEQAKDTYEANFNKSKYIIGDLSKNEDLELIIASIGKDLDLLVGGPPCKGFSTLNNSKVDSKYNTLVDQYLKVVEGVEPNVFLIENVRGFKSKKHPTGVTYPEHVKDTVKRFKKSYYVHDFLLNANDFGVAQNRIRYFMIGVKLEFDPEKSLIDFFVSEVNKKINDYKPILKDAIKDLPSVKVREGQSELTLDCGKVIYNHKSMNHSSKLEERFSYVPAGGGLMNVPFDLLTNHLKKVVNGDYGSGGFAKNIYGRMSWEKPSGTIVAGMDKITVGRFVHPEENRLLTPRECARIQSFPDSFRFLGGMVSQYYQIGNAVPPKISELFSGILEKAISHRFINELKELECS